MTMSPPSPRKPARGASTCARFVIAARVTRLPERRPKAFARVHQDEAARKKPTNTTWTGTIQNQRVSSPKPSPVPNHPWVNAITRAVAAAIATMKMAHSKNI